jgi:hypothetical protein
MPSLKRTLVGGVRQVMEDDAWTDGHVVCTYRFWMPPSEDGRTGYLQLGLDDDSIFHARFSRTASGNFKFHASFDNI